MFVLWRGSPVVTCMYVEMKNLKTWYLWSLPSVVQKHEKVGKSLAEKCKNNHCFQKTHLFQNTENHGDLLCVQEPLRHERQACLCIPLQLIITVIILNRGNLQQRMEQQLTKTAGLILSFYGRHERKVTLGSEESKRISPWRAGEATAVDPPQQWRRNGQHSQSATSALRTFKMGCLSGFPLPLFYIYIELFTNIILGDMTIYIEGREKMFINR